MAIDSERDTTGVRVLKLIDIARGLEDEGQNNAAKVFRAAAASEVNSMTRYHARQGSGLESAMEDIIAEMTSAGRDPVLVQMLERARSNVIEDRWSTLDDFPRTFVCRMCGFVEFQNQPDVCPTCGARPLTFEEILPIYYLDPIEQQAVLPGLEASLAEVERITSGVTVEEAERGVWPLREIVAHLLGAERLLSGRAVRMLDEDEPLLTSVSASNVAEDTPASTQKLVEQFRQARMNTLERFGDLDPADWQRGGYHPEWGRLTIHQQLSYVLVHEQHHMAELELRRNGG